MDIQKIAFTGMLVLLPVTAGLTAVTGVLYRDVERCRDEISELRKSHHPAPEPAQITDDNQTDGIIVPKLPEGSVNGVHKRKKPSAGIPSRTGESNGDGIRLMEHDEIQEEKSSQGITLIDHE